jgi:hypothetical protein
MKAKKAKFGKAFEIISDNPKMDTYGLVGKPKPVELYEWKPPAMSIGDMMEVREMKTNKRPEMDS